MSFYGTVFYEFERLFYKFKFKNVTDTEDSVDLREIDSVDGVVATERWDTFHIDSGNRWIKLATMPEDGERKGVTIFHGAAGGTQTTVDAIEPQENDEENPITPDVQLEAQQCFKVPTISYDNAGHIAEVTTRMFQMPDPQKVIEQGMPIHFEDGPVTPQGFEHESEFPEEEEAYVVLEPGQKVAVNKLIVSEQGVITGVEPVYYKMPASKSEQDFAEFAERLETIEEFVEEVPTIYATQELTGSIEDLYYDLMESGIDSSNRFSSIATAVGNIEESSRKITGEYRTAGSLAQQLIAVYDLASSINASLTNLLSQQDARIQVLERKVEELTKRIEELHPSEPDPEEPEPTPEEPTE